MTATVDGRCEARFERLRDLLAANVAAGKEVGASLHVTVDGEEVVDLWGGWRDRGHSAPWNEDTIVAVFSASKTVTSLAMLMLHDRGLIDLFAPVAEYWPEFGVNGKAGVQVRHLLSHTAGLPAWEPPFSMADAMDIRQSTQRLADQAPWWEPGTRGTYHASTFGHLNAELVRRVTGTTLREFIATEIAGPLGADFHLGVSQAEAGRVATIYPVEGEIHTAAARTVPAADDGLQVERGISARIRLGSFSGVRRNAFELFNSPDWRRTAFGGSSGHANARALGRVVSVLGNDGTARGTRLLSAATAGLVFQEQANGIDAYYMKPIRWGIGYALAAEGSNSRGPLPFVRPGKRTCFWYGTGGSLVLADAERRITVAYAMNQCQSGRRCLNGVYYDAVYDCLSIPSA